LIIQIFGTKKCRETKKAERFFKERKIQVQFIDLTQKAISKGELNSILKSIELADLLDRDSKRFKELYLQYSDFDIEEKLLAEPLLFKTPIVRFQTKATLGFQPEIWKKWAEENTRKI